MHSKRLALRNFIYLMHSCYTFTVLHSYQALAELYVIDGQYEKAFALYADVSQFMTFLITITPHQMHP